ncbi:MAG: Phosphoribosylglycinamide formyltransferase [Syntrophaceae bacterium PtaU1.Bin231]|nr:MAG: Phosphoribosylglycinamide formyltransferase [Syntrophaceae bacterium PtaU1.Bin231]HOG15990.1 phosphoribosylglycinamide formyltransferase [Syntrophales bacterium]
MKKDLAIGVLVSGSGSNLQSLIDHIEAGKLSARIEVVISNNPTALGVERAKRHGIPCFVVDHRDFASREDFDRELIRILHDRKVDLVALAGFMRVLSPLFLKTFAMRIMNIHPALLPSFPGTHGQRQAFEFGVKLSGCTVHFVDEGVDTGPIIVQAAVPVREDDTDETLAARILKEEHRIYPQAIQWYAEGRLSVEGRRVYLRGGRPPADVRLHHPPLEGF